MRDSFAFTVENFLSVAFRSAFSKPTVLALVYYEWHGMRTPLINELAKVRNKPNMQVNKVLGIYYEF